MLIKFQCISSILIKQKDPPLEQPLHWLANDALLIKAALVLDYPNQITSLVQSDHPVLNVLRHGLGSVYLGHLRRSRCLCLSNGRYKYREALACKDWLVVYTIVLRCL
jgi:hypothetical protein